MQADHTTRHTASNGINTRLMQQAEEAASAGKFKDAMRLFDQAIIDDPKRAFYVYTACLQFKLPDTQAYKDLWQAQADRLDSDKFDEALKVIWRRQPARLTPPQAPPTLTSFMHRNSRAARTPPSGP